MLPATGTLQHVYPWNRLEQLSQHVLAGSVELETDTRELCAGYALGSL